MVGIGVGRGEDSEFGFRVGIFRWILEYGGRDLVRRVGRNRFTFGRLEFWSWGVSVVGYYIRFKYEL